MTSRAKQKRQSRQRLLQTAAQKFRVQGYAATGVSDITKHADLTNGAFYAHFESKQQLLKNALKSACEESRTYWYQQDDIDHSSDPLDWLKQVLMHYLSAEHRGLAENGCIVPTLAAEVAREGEEIRACFETEVGANIAPMQQVLDSLGDDMDDSAWGLLSLMAGSVLLSRAVADQDLSDRILKTSQAIGNSYLATLPEG